VQQGILTEADIDKALVNIFTIRMRMGEFDPREIVPYAGIKPAIINDPSHNDLALEVATKTPVLLKNSTITETGEKALPIDLKRVKKIAVLGPQADKVELGDYSGEVEPHLSISPLEGIQNYIREHNLNTEIVSVISGNTDRKTDFLNREPFFDCPEWQGAGRIRCNKICLFSSGPYCSVKIWPDCNKRNKGRRLDCL
jgi:beta-glucosidase